MSESLLFSIGKKRNYLQSPVDDLWSFYYVAQWAAVFNRSRFSVDGVILSYLKLMQDYLLGSQRAAATSDITSQRIRKGLHGGFLFECSKTLRKWYTALVQLEGAWLDKLETLVKNGAKDNQYELYYPLFQEFTDQGILDLLTTVEEAFPKCMSGGSIHV